MWWSFYFLFLYLSEYFKVSKVSMDGFYIQEKKIILDFSINNKISRKTSFQDTGKELRSCEIP